MKKKRASSGGLENEQNLNDITIARMIEVSTYLGTMALIYIIFLTHAL